VLNDEPLIAIVDDDESVRVAMGGMVESFGYAPVTFESANDFLKSDKLPDASCLILDVQMPGMSGLELHSQLIASGRRIPTIFVTAFPDRRVRDRAMRAPAASASCPSHSDETIFLAASNLPSANRRCRAA
jgi:FixJ family two-component response regulator